MPNTLFTRSSWLDELLAGRARAVCSMSARRLLDGVNGV